MRDSAAAGQGRTPIGDRRSRIMRRIVAQILAAIMAVAPALAQSGGQPAASPDVQAQLDEMREMIRRQNELIEGLRGEVQRLRATGPGAPGVAATEPRTGAPATVAGKEPVPGTAPVVAAKPTAETSPAKAEVAAKDVAGGAVATGAQPSPEGVEQVADAKPDAPPQRDERLYDTMHKSDDYGIKSLWDSLHPEGRKPSPWYEKLSVRGYTQIRFDRTLDYDGAQPFLFGDRFINGKAENFGIRRARLIFSGDVSKHLSVYIQPDFASSVPGSSTTTYFAQLRDIYSDIYVDTTRIHRFRVGLSKVPYGFENLQSSQNRVPLDRAEALNTAVAPNERDLGVFYYFTPQEKQKLFRDLVDGGLKGSGNYGIFALGAYDGQGGSQFELNQNVHVVSRLTWPFLLPSGQAVEASIQGYIGRYVVQGSPIYPRGTSEGSAATPKGTGGNLGIPDQRVAGSFVWYAQPFGLETEWNYGDGPGLNNVQTAVVERSLWGGYVLPSYKIDTSRFGIITPYARYQYWKGGYRNLANAPYGSHTEWDLGVEWQIFRELEFSAEYGIVQGINATAINTAGQQSYLGWSGDIIRFQLQFNY